MIAHTHRHMVLATGEYVWHSHEHVCADGPLADFNLLHHHAPVEHDQLDSPFDSRDASCSEGTTVNDGNESIKVVTVADLPKIPRRPAPGARAKPVEEILLTALDKSLLSRFTTSSASFPLTVVKVFTAGCDK